VRSAASLASVAPEEPFVQSAKKRQRHSAHRDQDDDVRDKGTLVRSVESADSCHRDMAPFYRAVLYGQDGNQDAGGLAFSLEHMSDTDPNPRTPEVRHDMPPKPVEADRLLSVFLRKEFPKTTKLKAVPFWKLAMASEKGEQGLKTFAFKIICF
jgi:hypothetical protein